VIIARRTMTFAAADLIDADAIKTSVATSTDAVAYTSGDFDGAAKTPEGFAGFADVGAIPCVSSSSAAGAYTPGSTVTFTGPWRGETVTRVATLAEEDGNETAYADGPLDGAPTAIDVEAQADTDGAFTFGWGGVAPLYTSGTGAHQRLWWVRCGETAGDIHVRYSLGEDTIAATAGAEYTAAVAAVLGDTAVELTILEA
jgi:hypothetical protein